MASNSKNEKWPGKASEQDTFGEVDKDKIITYGDLKFMTILF